MIENPKTTPSKNIFPRLDTIAVIMNGTFAAMLVLFGFPCIWYGWSTNGTLLLFGALCVIGGILIGIGCTIARELFHIRRLLAQGQKDG